MSPSSTSNEFSPEQLLSEKARTRKYHHFTANVLDNAPKGFKLHPKPLMLSHGTPNPEFFPVDKIDVHVPNFPYQKSLFPDKSNNESFTINKYGDEYLGLEHALQYSDSKGLPGFQKILKELVSTIYSPKSDWDILATKGSGEGLSNVMDTIIDPGDPVLVEEFTFLPTVGNIRSAGGIPVPVKFDLEQKHPDIDVNYITHLLENWDTLRPEFNGRKPKAFYTIPNFQNPIGTTQSQETREKIYDLARIHNFAIVEDDPYGYLNLAPFKKPNINLIEKEKISVEQYISKLPKSYIDLDTDGRVIRVETFSKVIAPGLRLGFIVAHKRVVTALVINSNLTIKAPSGVSQAIVVNLLEKKFSGIHGYLEWILKMRLAYSHKRNVLLDSIFESSAHKKGFFIPILYDGGMFASVEIKFPKDTDLEEKFDLLKYKFLEHGVHVVFGIAMAVDKDFSLPRSNFLRLTFSALSTDNELYEAGRRLGNAIEDFFDKGLEF